MQQYAPSLVARHGSATPKLIAPFKQWRAFCILEWMRRAGKRGCVCFSCGNASAAIKQQSLPETVVIDISPTGVMQPNRWWSSWEIAQAWPDLFDATSGHLPMPLMVSIGQFYRGTLSSTIEMPRQVFLPSGSGETLVCLAMAYPEVKWIAEYDNNVPATTFNEEAPLNALVKVLADVHIIERRGQNGNRT